MSAASLAGAPWLDAPASRTVLDALAGAGAETRFVGGVVRDALAGRPVADIDLATTLPPEETLRRLETAGLKAVPTGLAHGTVTAVADGRPIEVTTLRRDVATDGRRATVAFTDDWRADAARRDFTINAMSADRTGRVFDYFGGAADLAAGRVRFVGEPGLRVAEDYLRILRFFRFHAWYGQGEPDAAGLAACAAGVPGLGRVSAERVRAELLRLLAAPDPAPTVAAMAAAGVAQALIGHEPAVLARLTALEAAAGRAPDALLRLAALAPGEAEALALRLRLSRVEHDVLAGLAPPWDDLGADAAAWARALHRLGAEPFARRALLAAASGAAGAEAALPARLAAAAAWRPRSLPVSGKDLVALGLTPGPAVGAMLDALEAHWLAEGFRPDRAALLALARERLDAGKEGA